MARKRQLPDDGEIIVVQRAPKIQKKRVSSIQQAETECQIPSASQRARRLKNSRSRTAPISNDLRAPREHTTDLETAEATVKARSTGKQASLKRSRDNDNSTASPKAKRNRHELPPSPAETPSKKTAKLFDRLQLQGLKVPKEMGQITPPATPESLKGDFMDMLPTELVELVAMYSAVVNSISAQLATNVSTARINVKELLDMATSTWSKRTVVLSDLRRVLGLVQHPEIGFQLEDFGRAGVFLVVTGTERLHRRVAVLDTSKLRKTFESDLRAKWQQWSEQSSQDGNSPSSFVTSLPLSTIIADDSVRAAEPLFSRGKQRLADLKASQAIAVEARSASIVPATTSDCKTTHNSRSNSLLDRILAKQTYNASLPAGPTKEQLERKSALHRVEEIARTLEVLSAGRARASFSMQSIVQQLQQSLRSPMSRIEVEACLKIMAEEIMPSFVSTISSGTVCGIVITRNGRLGIADLKKRLADAGI